MALYLLIRLWGPMMAWGTPPGVKVRPTLDHPTKSAIFSGLVGAALGLSREDEEEHLALTRGYGMAVQVDCQGQMMRDFQTMLVPKANMVCANRADEIRQIEEVNLRVKGTSRINPMTTYRDYRVNAHYTVCIWAKEGSRWSLEELAEAIREPKFPLYFGRRCCIPGIPLQPQVLEAPTVLQALSDVRFMDIPGLTPDQNRRVLWDACEHAGMTPHVTHRIRDELVSRVRWQFTNRTVYETMLDQEGQPCS